MTAKTPLQGTREDSNGSQNNLRSSRILDFFRDYTIRNLECKKTSEIVLRPFERPKPHLPVKEALQQRMEFNTKVISH